jgi:hypothetical protein
VYFFLLFFAETLAVALVISLVELELKVSIYPDSITCIRVKVMQIALAFI